jgi:hypothetical protein
MYKLPPPLKADLVKLLSYFQNSVAIVMYLLLKTFGVLESKFIYFPQKECITIFF